MNLMRAKTRGQATVEYIFILAFILYFSGRATGLFGDFFRNNMGKVGHFLSMNLVVGVCPTRCFFSSYRNGYKPQ